MLPVQYQLQRWRDWQRQRIKLEQQLFEAAVCGWRMQDTWITLTLGERVFIDIIPLLKCTKRGLLTKTN